MAPRPQSRRQFGCGVLTVAGIALAGCLGDDDDDTEEATDDEGDDDTNESADDTAENDTDDSADLDDMDDIEIDDDEEDEPSIAISLENEEEEPIESGATVNLDHEDGTVSFTFNLDEMDDADKEDGTVVAEPITQTGTYEIVASSNEDEFDPVEETVDVEQADLDNAETVAITLVLEGASPAEDDEDDE